MIFTRVVRQFHRGPEAPVTLEQDFAFTAAPTVGSQLRLAGVGRPLSVVSILLRPTPNAHVAVPQPGLEIFTAWEPAESVEPARACGWQDRPQPPEQDS